MDVREFLSPKFIGKRFEGHALPLEFLRDLASLNEMVTEVAKQQYFKSNPGRQRVSPGFGDDISLVMTEIKEGSAIPVIGILAGMSGLFLNENLEDYMEARDAIVGAISAAAEGKSPRDFLNDKGLAYFEKFGRSLRDGEVIEFTTPDSNTPARLTKETRRNLLLSSPKVEEVTEEVEIRGLLDVIKQGANTFTVKMADGNEVTCPITDEDYENITDAIKGYRRGAKILLQGVGVVNRQGKILRIDTIEHSALLDPQDIPARFEELRLLKAGWFDGAGVALSAEGLDWLASNIQDRYPKSLPLPHAYPVPDGGIQFEWSINSNEVSLEIDLLEYSAYWHSLDTATGKIEERDVNLTVSTEWDWIARRIGEMKGENSSD